MKKFIKYFIFALLAVVVAKWIILLLPSNHKIVNKTVKQTPTTQVIHHKKEIKEVELSLDFEALKPKIEKEYKLAQEDINNYIQEQINSQKEEAKYRLTKKDGFLDWLFGYFTGWKIMYKKVKGLFGSKDNEVEMVSDKFKKDVINPGLSDMYENINDYAKNRMEDYYKTVMTMTTNYINENISKLKQKGYMDIKIDTTSLPWSQYIVARGGDVLAITEIRGLGMGAMIGKYVGSKVAAIIGPKLLGLVEAKTATIIASKIASAFELILAPILDYAANEAVRAVKYNDTKKDFEKIIDNIFNNIQSEVTYKIDEKLIEVKNQIYQELNKKIKIHAKEIR